MNAVLVAMHLVACQPDLLICEDISGVSQTWDTMEACRQDRDGETIRARRLLAPQTVVMSRCRYQIRRDGRSLPMF
ncbi:MULTISPECIES: hypothetical protein [unclassified Roseibium]|uniref:hypothetical protein n=1 Tax=unclassified Roseibium TaxID=2629323 RepID=UPI0031762859